MLEPLVNTRVNHVLNDDPDCAMSFEVVHSLAQCPIA
jgi:hypothetical protein